MNQSILAIDDSEDIHHLLKVRLRPEGLDLRHSLTAEDGLQQARATLPDLVLLDIDMPDVTGFEVCRALKADPLTQHIPIIFLTGAANVFNKVEGFELGAVDYVTKPFDAAELRARVRSALRTKRFQDLLATRAQVDGLTGLWNRAYFDRHLQDEMNRARRESSSVGLLMLDIDHFKGINDQFGHPFGDRVIATVSEVISGSLRPYDAACRYGGEEFAIILGNASADAVMIVANRIQHALGQRTFNPGQKTITVTLSIGVGSTSELGSAVDHASFVEVVDRALYAAKHGGRNRVCRIAT